MKIKVKKDLNFAIIKIRLSSNNTFVTLTDLFGNVLLNRHIGQLKLEVVKKRSPYISGEVMKSFIVKVLDSLITVEAIIVEINGAIQRGFRYRMFEQMKDLEFFDNIIQIVRSRKKAHNGVRLRKSKRL